jgi:inorganic pyrophosphatase
MVAAHDPVFPGCVVKARVIGALEMYEGGQVEYNVFGLPSDDPRFDDIETLDNMPEQNLREIEQFFTAFKRLEGDEEAEVKGWCGPEETYEIIRKSTR